MAKLLFLFLFFLFSFKKLTNVQEEMTQRRGIGLYK